jgi:tripartite-type tricarboxylate transporter receptor subunit TctC
MKFLAILAAIIVGNAHAQQWPAKPIRLVLPFPPGGPVDVVARTVGPRFGERVGQPLIIENRVGAGGNIGGDHVLKSPADGYTLLFVTAGLVTNPFFLKGSPEPGQFAGVIQLLNAPFMLVASNAFPAKTLPEIVAQIRAKPGAVSCASSGALPTVGCELLRSYAKADMIMVQYKGNAPAMQAVMSGEANLLFDPANTAAAQVRAGRVRPIATASPQRGHDLPALAETFPDFHFEGFHGIAVQPSTPRDMIQRMNREFAAIMALPDVREPLAKVGFEVATGSPEAFDTKLRGDFARFGRVMKDAGIKPE